MDYIGNVRLGLEQKNVIIQRDRYGYGLTVSGDNPVYVLSVREGGAAQRAGININDQIIKVEMSSFFSLSWIFILHRVAFFGFY